MDLNIDTASYLVERADHAFVCALEAVDAERGLLLVSMTDSEDIRAKMRLAYPLRTFGVPNQANHLFISEEPSETGAVRILIFEDLRIAVPPSK